MLSYPVKKFYGTAPQGFTAIEPCMNHYRLGYFPIARSKNSLCSLKMRWKVSTFFICSFLHGTLKAVLAVL